MLNCQTCGACCYHRIDDKWIEVTEQDSLSISHDLLQDGDIAKYSMKMRDNRCVCLSGSLGQSVSCLIYNNRPTICRQVQPGDSICLQAISENLGKNF